MSERAVLALLLCGCALFGAALVAELRPAAPDAPAGVARAARLPAVPAVHPAPPSPSLEQLVATILARPLFSATRRPPQDQGRAETGITDMRLTGIVTAPLERFAIFAVTGAKPLIVKEGEEVSGWRIEAIAPDAVSVSGPGGTETLQPKSDKSLVRAASTAAAPPAHLARPTGLARSPFLRAPGFAAPGFAAPGFAAPRRPAPPGARR